MVTLPNVRTHVPTLRSAASSGPQANPVFSTVAAAVSTIQDALDQLASQTTTLQASLSALTGIKPAAGGISSSYLRVTLATSTTAISSGIAAPNNFDELLVDVVQETTTGGKAITWAAEFATDTTTDISSAPGARSRFSFRYFNALWNLICDPYRLFS